MAPAGPPPNKKPGYSPAPRAKFVFFLHFTLLEWNVKNCFVKLIKSLKLTEIFIIALCMPIAIYRAEFSLIFHEESDKMCAYRTMCF